MNLSKKEENIMEWIRDLPDFGRTIVTIVKHEGEVQFIEEELKVKKFKP